MIFKEDNEFIDKGLLRDIDNRLLIYRQFPLIIKSRFIKQKHLY